MSVQLMISIMYRIYDRNHRNYSIVADESSTLSSISPTTGSTKLRVTEQHSNPIVGFSESSLEVGTDDGELVVVISDFKLISIIVKVLINPCLSS